MASSVCCVVYASHEKLRVQSSLASWMLRGPVAWRLRTVLVPASRSQVLTRLVAPPRVAISARIPSMADCRVTGEGPGVLEGEDLRVVPVEAGVLSGLVGRLGQVGQKRRSNPLVHVGQGEGRREEGGGRGGGGREEGGGEREEGGGREEEGGERRGGEKGGEGRRQEERREGGRRREDEEEGGGGRRREEEGGGGEKGGEGREREREERERKRERERERERARKRERERDRHRDRANQRSNTCNRPTTQTHLDNTYQMIRDYVLSSLAHIELLAFGILGV